MNTATNHAAPEDPAYLQSGSNPLPTNGATSKAPEEGTGGFVAQTKMAVQPPKKEDLQKSYATVVTDEANPKGTYAKMSTLSPLPWLS